VLKKEHSFTCHPHVYPQVEQGNRRSHFARAVHSHYPPSRPIHFAANALQCIVNGKETSKTALPHRILSPCRRRTEPRPQATCTEKLVKIARVVPEISWRTDRQRHRQTDMLITVLRHRSRGEVMTIPAFTLQPQSVTAPWPVLIFRPVEGRRLSLPDRVAGYKPRWFTLPQTVTHPSTNRARLRVTSLIETSAIPLNQAATSVQFINANYWTIR